MPLLAGAFSYVAPLSDACLPHAGVACANSCSGQPACTTAHVLPGPDLFSAESPRERARFGSGAIAPVAIRFCVHLLSDILNASRSTQVLGRDFV